MGSRNWCFTAFNLMECACLKDWEHRKYIIWGVEKCPTTGKEHYQGYIELLKPQRLAAMHKLTPNTHFESRKGTQEQAITYCKKDGNFIEEGEKAKGQGHRTDIEELKDSLDQNKNLKEISELHFDQFLRFNKSIKEYQLLHQPARNWTTELLVLFGAPGTGKSKDAFSLDTNAYPMLQPTNGAVYFDGYIGQETIIIDDFYGWIPYSLLLKMADRYPLIVHTKGSSANFIPKKIVITSNSNPLDWYTNPDIDINALLRRITGCYYYPPKGDKIQVANKLTLEKLSRKQSNFYEDPTYYKKGVDYGPI